MLFRPRRSDISPRSGSPLGLAVSVRSPEATRAWFTGRFSDVNGRRNFFDYHASRPNVPAPGLLSLALEVAQTDPRKPTFEVSAGSRTTSRR